MYCLIIIDLVSCPKKLQMSATNIYSAKWIPFWKKWWIESRCGLITIFCKTWFGVKPLSFEMVIKARNWKIDSYRNTIVYWIFCGGVANGIDWMKGLRIRSIIPSGYTRKGECNAKTKAIFCSNYIRLENSNSIRTLNDSYWLIKQ